MVWLKNTSLRRYSVVPEAGVVGRGIEASPGKDPESAFWSIYSHFPYIPPRDGLLGNRRTGEGGRHEIVWPGKRSAKVRWRGRFRDQGQDRIGSWGPIGFSMPSWWICMENPSSLKMIYLPVVIRKKIHLLAWY